MVARDTADIDMVIKSLRDLKMTLEEEDELAGFLGIQNQSSRVDPTRLHLRTSDLRKKFIRRPWHSSHRNVPPTRRRCRRKSKRTGKLAASMNSFYSLRNSAVVFRELRVTLLFSVSIAAQIVRAIKTNVCVLVFLTMGAT